jgi:Zn-dependent M16 (insulinase) family peptidase
MAVVFGKPSAALSNRIQDSEQERECQQRKDLGVEGLAHLAKILEAAMEENERPIPGDILTSLPVPDVEKVPSIPLFTARLYPSSTDLVLKVVPESIRDVREDESEAIIAGLKGDSLLTSVPFHADLTHIESAFVFMAVGIDTSSLVKEQRLYLPLLNEILFKLPATLEDGSQLSKEQFVNSIHDETVSYSCGVGLLGGAIPQMCYISAQVDSGLATALKWIRRALYLTNITTDSVKTAVQKLISEISPQIRSGPTVSATVAAELIYAEKSNTLACNFLRQKPFLSKIFEAIESGNDAALQVVVQELDMIRNILFQTSNYHAFLAANVKVIPKVLDTLVESLTRPDKVTDSECRLIENVSASSALRAAGDDSPGGYGAVCALSAIESGFLSITAPGVKAYDDNHASLLVAIDYLTALEGDLWVKLRGAGLTYSYSISESTDSQILKFSLFKCTDIAAAYETASNIIAGYAKGNFEVSAIGLENAKSTLAYQIIRGRGSKL